MGRVHSRKKFALTHEERHMPTMVQAGVYSAVLHYLKALDALGSNPDDGAKVVAKMKEMPVDDPLFGKGNDPRRRPQYPSRVSLPGEKAVRIEGSWDYYVTKATIPADQAFRPLSESECPLVKK